MRVAVGEPGNVFSPPLRFWTSGDSAYFSHRIGGGISKASFHPADERHTDAVWNFAFTAESGLAFGDTGKRQGYSWKLEETSIAGIYAGPAISIPRLVGRPYDLPVSGPHVDDLDDVTWVDAPHEGHARFLAILIDDNRPGLTRNLAAGEQVVGTLEISKTGWGLSLLTAERPLKEHEIPPLVKILDEAVMTLTPKNVEDGSGPVPPQPGIDSAAVDWITTSPDGPPLFVQIVLDSSNYAGSPKSLSEQSGQ